MAYARGTFRCYQEYRFNHRYTGKHFMEKIARYIRQFVPMTNQVIGNALDSYNARFVLLTKLTERSSLSKLNISKEIISFLFYMWLLLLRIRKVY